MRHSRLPLSLSAAVPVLVTVLAYIPALAAYFYEDDWGHILFVSNPHSNPWILHTFFYRPLFLVVFGWFYRLFGFHASLWHAATLSLHLVNVLLVYSLARRLRLGSTGACLGALIFGIFPGNVGAVSWLCAVSGLMAAFFCLISAHIALTQRIPVGVRGMLSVAVWTLALLSKEEAAGFVFVLPLLPAVTGTTKGRKRIAIWGGCSVLMALVLGGLLHIERQCTGVYGNTAAALDADTIRRAIYFTSWWIRGAVWPGLQMTLWSASLTALLPIIAWYRFPSMRPGLCWWLGTAMAIGVAIGRIGPLDRYGYMPSIGLALGAAALANRVTSNSRPLGLSKWLIAGTVALSMLPDDRWRWMPAVLLVGCCFADFRLAKTRDNAALTLAVLAVIYRESEALLYKAFYAEFPLWITLAAPAAALVVVMAVNRRSLSPKRAAELVLCACLVFWASYAVYHWFLMAVVLAELACRWIKLPAARSERLAVLRKYSLACFATVFVLSMAIAALYMNTGWYKKGVEVRQIADKTVKALRQYPEGTGVLIEVWGTTLCDPRIFNVCAELIAHRPDLKLTILGGAHYKEIAPGRLIRPGLSITSADQKSSGNPGDGREVEP